jgi:26S proteasome regulatory subunit N4
MGLPMMDNLSTIHVPSGPSSVGQDRSDLQKLSISALIARKDKVEEELRALSSVLSSHGVTMTTTLTTFDGFPRDDIDVAQIRTTRHRIIILRNDWKELMDLIEKGLHQHHADIQAANALKPQSSSISPQPTEVTPSVEPVPQAVFARVNEVIPGSPAQEAGLQKDDQIRQFGSANWSNHERLRRVGEIVQGNVGRPIVVKVLRGTGQDARELSLTLVPRQGWGGRGLLGCHIV